MELQRSDNGKTVETALLIEPLKKIDTICEVFNNASWNRIYPELPASAPCYVAETSRGSTHLWGNFDEDMENRMKKLESVILTERPSNRWECVVGAELAKNRLIEHVAVPALTDNSWTNRPEGNILLHGPPGCGKTFLCNTLAGELVGVGNLTFIAISPSDIFGTSVKDGSQNVRALFELGRRRAPCIIIIDDMEEILSKQEDNGQVSWNWTEDAKNEIVEEFLEQMYFFSPERKLGVTLIATTTFPWKIDERILCYFEHMWPVPYPNEMERMIILKNYLIQQQMGDNFSDEDLYELGKRSERYAYADLFQLSCDIWKVKWKNLTFSNWYKPIQGISSVNGKMYTNAVLDNMDNMSQIPKGWKFIGVTVTCEPVRLEEVLACLNSRKPSVRDGVPAMWATDLRELDYSICEADRDEVSCSRKFYDGLCGLWSMLGTGFMYLLSQI